MWIENNCICFHGTGELHVTVKPSAPSIQYSTPTGEHITKSVSSGETITIDPDTYKYERNIDASGNATYTIKLQLDNVQISDPQMVDTMNIYEYIKLRLPEMSRSVDSSRNSNNNFVYNILGAETTGINDYINYNHNSSFAWNAATECWEYSNTSGSNYLECGQYPGDMYWTINVENTQATQSYLCFCTNPNKYEYFDAGLFRLFNPFGGTAWRDNRGNCYPFEVHNCGAGGISFAIGGLTMPINTILYYALAKNIDTYRNINAAGGILYDNDMICQVVTTQACDNLKTEFGDNLRIYVIKYKKLKEKPHKVNTNLRITCDYTYIDACASSPTCIYEATNPLELNTALKAIAKDIKLWTGYHDGYVEECHD
jgi:hypothetical protein